MSAIPNNFPVPNEQTPSTGVNRTAQQLRCWVRSALVRFAGRLHSRQTP